jgi:cellulose synthase/poly-beta-1,6-N-acetylglucosamine synthase-like glycosyltransferase
VAKDDKLLGKMNALSQGIKKSTGEIILVTDADCIVPPGWIKEIVSYFKDNIGLVGGMTLLSQGSSQERFYDLLQAVDWIFLQGIAAGSAGIGLPVSVLGNNFGFRRKAYEEVGGYDELGFSLTEDMILLKAIVSTTDWQVIYPLSPVSAIYSKPVENLKQFYHQRKRWITGGKEAPIWGLFLMILSMVTHLFVFLLFFVSALNLPNLLIVGILFLSDFIFICRLLNRFNLKKLLIYFPVYEIYYFSYTLIFAILMTLPTQISWKDRSY